MMIWFSWYLQPETDGYDSDKNVEFSGGNVHLITTKESWDQKMAEASRDGKIVSIPSPSPPSFPPPLRAGPGWDSESCRMYMELNCLFVMSLLWTTTNIFPWYVHYYICECGNDYMTAYWGSTLV